MSLIGKRLGNYDIQGKLGEGGMGIVYMGVHPQIGKKVAVKVLHPELSDKADVVTRFFNEAKAVNDINHPNIVDIIDFGEATVDGTTFKYIMMEFLDGESLSARMRREGVTIRESVSILAQCCSALSASHAKGVVHRDAYVISKVCFHVGHFGPQRRRNRPCPLTVPAAASSALTSH